MNEVKKTTLRLTILYSLIFFFFTWALSFGLYVWTNNALGEGYVNRINEVVEKTTNKNSNRELSDGAATIAADIALDRMRNILLGVNAVSLLVIPALAYWLSRRSLQPLIKSQENQQQFISNASHELRTPLAVIAGELELSAKRQRSVQEYRTTIKNASTEVERMTVLIQELLLLSRLSASADLYGIEQIAVKDILQRIVGTYHNKAKKKHVDIEVTGHTDAVLDARLELLVIAFSNLLDNAIKFSPSNSPVSIDILEEKTKLIVRFQNHGPKISPEKISHLFERFYQSETSHADQGYGLGLTITKEIIDLHKGTVSVTSHDAATTLQVILPISATIDEADKMDTLHIT